MANMSYCRFQNTLKDLRDCETKFADVESIEEAQAALKLYQLCAGIADRYSEEELEEQLADLKEEDAKLDAE